MKFKFLKRPYCIGNDSHVERERIQVKVHITPETKALPGFFSFVWKRDGAVAMSSSNITCVKYIKPVMGNQELFLG
jgi:hypothetical protein